MAKKRINMPFIVISLLVMALLAGGGYTLYRLRKNDPNRVLKIAAELKEQGRISEAAAHIAGAANLKKDPALFVESGDLYYGLTYEVGQDALANAIGMYKAATQTDPGYVPAYEKLIAAYQDQFEAASAGGAGRSGQQAGVQSILSAVDDYAKAILRVQPDHALAKRTQQINVVTRVLSGVEIAPELVEQAIKSLEELHQKNPKDVEVALALARQKLFELSKSASRLDATQLKQSADEAIKLVGDMADADPQNADLRAKVAQLCFSAAGAMGQEKQLSEAYLKRCATEMDTARKVLKPTDEEYAEIMMFGARVVEVAASLQNAGDGAEKDSGKAVTDTYREVLKNQPSMLVARIALAKRLTQSPATKDEAIELLKSAPPPDLAQLAGQRGLSYKSNEIDLKLQLMNMLIERASVTNDAAKRADTLKEVGSYFDPLFAKYGEVPALLTVRGKMEYVRGDVTAAYTTLSKAHDKSEKSVRLNPQIIDLTVLLARVAIETNQASQARKLMVGLLSNPDAPSLQASPELRLVLVRAYLKENDAENAKKQIEVLRKMIPNRPDVAEMYLGTLDMDKDAKEIKDTFDSLPETSRPYVMAKVGIARALTYDKDGKSKPDSEAKRNLDAEQKRLLEMMVQKDPKDIQAWVLLSRYWEITGKSKDKAKEVIASALKAIPNEPNLIFRQKELSGEDTKELVLQEIQKLPDGPQRQRALFSFYQQTNDQAKALEAALAWEKASPNDLDVKEVLFNLYLRKSNFDEAQKYAPALAAANRDKSGGKLYEWSLLMSRKKLDEAYKLAMDLTRDHPEFARNWLCLGQTVLTQATSSTDALLAKSKYEEAMPKFGEALNRDATSVDAYLGIIQCCNELQLFTESRRYIEQAIKSTNNAEFKEMLNQFEVRHGDPEKAIKQREDDLKSDAENPDRYAALAEAYSAVAQQKSQRADEAGMNDYFGKAAAVIAKAQEKFPDNIRLLMYYSELSVVLKNTDEAEKRWKVYAAGPGQKEPAKTTLAFSGFYRRAGKPAEAEALLRDAINKQGDKPDYMLQLSLSQLLTQQNKLDDALAVLAANQDQPAIMRSRIELLLRLNKIDEARKLIDESLAKTPSLDLQALRGGLKISAGDDAGGMKDIEEVRAKDPNNIPALIQASLRNFNVGQTNDAIADLLKVRQLLGEANNPATQQQMIQVRLLLAQAYQRAGQMDSCFNEMESALKLDPDQKTLRLQLIGFYMNGQPPRFSDAERLFRESHQLISTGLDPDMLAAEATMWSVRKDHPRAVGFIEEAIKQAGAKSLPSTQYVAQKLKIMLDARQYAPLIKFIDQQSAEFKNTWWVMRDRATAVYSDGNKPAGLAAYAAVIDKVVAANDIAAAGSIIDALIEADNGNTDGAIKLVGDRINTVPGLKLLIVRLHANKHNLPEARKLISELLALGDQLPPELQTGALQMAAQVWAEDPGRDESKAQDAYLKLAKLRPDDFAVWNNLACLESLSSEDALSYAQKAKDLMEKSGRVEPLVLDTYGSTLLRAGKVDEAITYLNRAYQALKFRDVCLHLADAYATQKSWDSVDQFLREAQELYDQDVKEKRVEDQGAFQEKITAVQKKIQRK